MNPSHNPHPERSPRKKATKRFFKDLVMPAVGHAKGEVSEEFQPKSDARSARFAVICSALAVLVLGSWIGLVQLRKAMRKRARQNNVSCGCGCGQQHGDSPCARNGVCPTPGKVNSGCRPGQAPAPGSASPDNSKPGPTAATTKPKLVMDAPPPNPKEGLR